MASTGARHDQGTTITDTPTHVEAWDTIPRGLDAYDRSRFRGDTPALDRAEAERVTNLGNGMTQVTYVDAPPPPEG